MANHKLIILLISTCIAALSDAVSISSTPLHLQSSDLTVDNGFQSSLSFGTCGKIHHSNSTLLCTLYIETDEPANSPRHLLTCNVTIKEAAKTEIVTLDETKTLLVLKHSNGSFSLLIVHFPDCKTLPVKLDNNLKAKQIKVVPGPYEGLFDVLLSEGKHCPKITDCGMTFDFDGRVYTKLQEWIDDKIHILTYVLSPNGRRLIADFAGKGDGYNLRVLSFDRDGYIDVLEQYPLQTTPGLPSLAQLSTTYQLFTVCTRNHLIFSCGQFDRTGKKTLDAEFQLYYDKLHSARVHNLPDGGFLLLLSECRYNDDACSESKDDFYVMKFDSKGDYSNTLEITEYKCKYGLELSKMRFFVSKRRELCLSYLCGSSNAYAEPKLDVICFSDSELDL